MIIHTVASVNPPARTRRCHRWIWMVLSLCLGMASSSQAQDVRGYRGRWNNWAYDAMALDRNAWRITLPAVAAADNDFKLASADWNHEWTHGGLMSAATVVAAYTSGGNSEMAATVGYHYTFAMNNVGYGTPGQMIVQETESSPVSISSVSHVLDGTTSTVHIATSAEPGGGEKIYVRHSLDGWASSSFAEASGGGTNWTATIAHDPAEAGQTCAYYVLTTTVSSPAHATADLQTLRWNDNGGSGYSYVVPGDPPPVTLYINEVLSSNDSSEQDEDGAYSDWLELYNPGATSVALAGWGLSDSYASPFKWTFGNVILPPGDTSWSGPRAKTAPPSPTATKSTPVFPSAGAAKKSS